jgi:hypothetical protein
LGVYGIAITVTKEREVVMCARFPAPLQVGFDLFVKNH